MRGRLPTGLRRGWRRLASGAKTSRERPDKDGRDERGVTERASPGLDRMAVARLWRSSGERFPSRSVLQRPHGPSMFALIDLYCRKAKLYRHLRYRLRLSVVWELSAVAPSQGDGVSPPPCGSRPPVRLPPRRDPSDGDIGRTRPSQKDGREHATPSREGSAPSVGHPASETAQRTGIAPIMIRDFLNS